MEERDLQRFQNLMLGMADNFRDTLSAEGLKLRWKLLRPYTIDQLEKAGVAILRRRKYARMPPVAEFIEEIEGEAISLDIQAESQWSIVIGQVRAVGSYGSPIFDDPITERLFLTRFRFGDICRSNDFRLGQLRREFVAAYTAESLYSESMIEDKRRATDLAELAGGLFRRIAVD